MTMNSPPKEKPSSGWLASAWKWITQPLGGGGVVASLNGAIRLIGLAGVLILLLTIWALARSCAPEPCGGQPINLLMIAAAAFAVGALVGYSLAAFGEEKQALGGISTAINSAIGGFAIADLTKADGVIRTVFGALARSTGMPGVGLTASVVAFFATLGFVCMYFNKQYLLNPAAARILQFSKQDERALLVTKSINIGIAEMDAHEDISPENVEKLTKAVTNFKEALEDPELFRSLSLDTIKSYSKAYYLLNDLNRAEEVLRKARALAPDDPDILFHLANVLIRTGRHEEAIAYLTFLEELPSHRVLTYKLLGFACLFVPGRLTESEVATKKYLAVNPMDVGAQLNLACVYGQRGPQDPANRDQAINLLLEVLRQDPSGAPQVIKPLLSGDGDFAAWAGVPDFKPVLDALDAALPQS